MAASRNRRSTAAAIALPWTARGPLRARGAERGFPLVPAMSFTPYAAATSVLPLAAAVHARSRTAALLAGGAAAVLAGAVLGPRGVRAPVPGGPRVRIATVSLRRGLVQPGPV